MGHPLGSLLLLLFKPKGQHSLACSLGGQTVRGHLAPFERERARAGHSAASLPESSHGRASEQQVVSGPAIFVPFNYWAPFARSFACSPALGLAAAENDFAHETLELA